MIYKAIQSFGPLKEYVREVEILDQLLQQRFWCRGKRGRWYERRALVLEHHLVKAVKDPEQKSALRFRALNGLKDAILDDDTGMGELKLLYCTTAAQRNIVYRPALVNRIQKLEKVLKIPREEMTICEGVLQKPPEVTVEAARAAPLKVDQSGRPIGKEDNGDIAERLGGTSRKEVGSDQVCSMRRS